MGKTSKTTAKERMRKYREKIKNDPNLYEETKRRERERFKKRVEDGKIKTAKTKMSDRNRRNLRRTWREKTRKYRASVKSRKQLLENLDSPPPSPCTSSTSTSIHNSRSRIRAVDDKRTESGKRIRRRNRQELKEKIAMLEKKLKDKNRQLANYRQRKHRSEIAATEVKEETPRRRVTKLLGKIKVTSEIRRKLIFGEVVQNQIKASFKNEQRRKKKREFLRKITGSIIRKYRFIHKIKTLTSGKAMNYRKKMVRAEHISRNKTCVKSFLEKDENSRLTPGKRDTITKMKMKKQKRLLNDTMKNLYHRFNTTHPNNGISYAVFCKYRPFWIVPPAVKNRDTCLCCVHENFSLLVQKLKSLKMIVQSSPQDVIQSVTCENQSEACLERKCYKCKEKVVQFEKYDETEDTTLQKWSVKKCSIMVKGKEKICNKTLKQVIECKKRDLVVAFEDSLKKFLKHTANMKHQFYVLDNLKKNLSSHEILIHVDFSENFNCKYASEIQAAHFGGSKPQVSLHTVVAYILSKETQEVQPLSFCTLSENLRHDPPAICAHLHPVIDELKNYVSHPRTVHFVSDGPTTQYRNRKMFHLIGKFIAPTLNVTEAVHWHYSEAGHGKGAPDGIGGCVKRTADRLVATGTDIPNFQTLYEKVKKEICGVKILTVNESELETIENEHLPKFIPAFKGTMRVHEVIWNKGFSSLQMRRLSCLQCPRTKSCPHYGLGTIQLRPTCILSGYLLLGLQSSLISFVEVSD